MPKVAAAPVVPHAQSAHAHASDKKAKGASDAAPPVASHWGPKPGARASASPAVSSARAAAGPGGVTRSPGTAVAFVNSFNGQLGLSADDIKAKDKHMASDPTHFLTAMPALFYQDVRGPFAAASQLRASPAPTGLLVGDAHLGNLMTRTSAEGKTVWGWGDCDKSGKGRLEWDLDRLATHTVLSARVSHQHFSKGDQKDLVDAVAAAYTQTMRDFAKTGERPAASLAKGDTTGALHDFIKKQAGQSQQQLVDKKAPGGVLPASQRASPADDQAIRAAVADYASRLPSDAPVARPVKVLSTGVGAPSVGGSNSGLVKYLAVLAPANPQDPPIILKFKQVLPSAPENGTGHLSASNAAQVVKNATTLEGGKDPLLGYATLGGRSCLVEPEEANSGILDPTKLKKKDFESLATSAGEALARSQLQSPSVTQEQVKAWLGDPSTDAAATKRLEQFALSYADQTEADAKALK